MNIASRIVRCIAMSALTFSSLQFTEAARRDTLAVKTLLVLGDSLSDGYGLARAQAYPALIAKKLRVGGYQFEVVNASASGGTTAGGVQRLPRHLSRPLDILVLELGINDAFRGIPVEQMRANLQTIMDRTKAKHPQVQIVIVGMQLPLYTADGYVRDFGEMFRALAEKNNTALVPYLLDGVAGNPNLNLPDRIHPNAAGQRLLAENVWRVLEPVARRVATDVL